MRWCSWPSTPAVSRSYRREPSAYGHSRVQGAALPRRPCSRPPVDRGGDIGGHTASRIPVFATTLRLRNPGRRHLQPARCFRSVWRHGLVGLVTVVYAFGEAASRIMPVLIFGMLLIGVV